MGSVKVKDTVEVIAGREKGKRGRVLKISRKADKVIVEKVNFVKRHTRPSQQSSKGGIVEKEGPISISNVMLICKKCNRPVRVRRITGADGVKNRTCVQCGELF